MIRKIITLFIILALYGTYALPALAARNVTKSYRISAIMPPHVGIETLDPTNQLTSTAKIRSDQTIIETVVVRNNEKFLLRTIVAQ